MNWVSPIKCKLKSACKLHFLAKLNENTFMKVNGWNICLHLDSCIKVKPMKNVLSRCGLDMEISLLFVCCIRFCFFSFILLALQSFEVPSIILGSWALVFQKKNTLGKNAKFEKCFSSLCCRGLLWSIVYFYLFSFFPNFCLYRK